jgi:hypothetical protein
VFFFGPTSEWWVGDLIDIRGRHALHARLPVHCLSVALASC